MKTQLTLLAACLLSVGLATAQTTTNPSSSSSGTTTNSTYGTTPTTTSGTNSSGTTYGTSPSSTSNSSGTMNSTGTTNSSGTMNSSGSMNNGSTTSPAYGTTTTDTYNTTGRETRDRNSKNYKNFVFGVYAGLNSTKFKGESVNTGGNLKGRLGYQGGFFVRGGGRLYGQLGAEYFASSSNYFTKGSGQTAKDIQSQIDIKYVQIPVYIGYKLVESDRGISAVRLQVGLAYANRINSNSGQFNLSNSEIKSGTFNGLGQLGFDAGPVFLDLTYHYGFSDAVGGTGFAGSQRRIVSASVGFKF